MTFRRLRTRIFVWVFGVVAVVQVAAFLIGSGALSRIASDAIDRHLHAGEQIFRQAYRSREARLLESARVIASDFAFREAVGTHDVPTVASALDNHGARLSAASSFLVGFDGQILAQAGASIDSPEGLAEWLARTPEEGSASVRRIGAHAYQVFAVPVRAPLPIAHLVLGFEIDEAFTAELRELSGLEIAFVDVSGPTPQPIAATVASANWSQLVNGQVDGGRRHDATYECVADPLDDEDGASVVALMMADRATLMAPYRSLGSLMAALMGVGLLLSAAGTIVVASDITRPLGSMANLARRYAAGDYEDVPSVQRPDEVGLLATAFRVMRDGLLDREGKIRQLAFYDPLTGLANRTLFVERLERALAAARRHGDPVTVLLLDLDRFQEINSALGHPAGDRILAEVGKRVSGLTRESDTLARLGGDEFALLLIDAHGEGAEVVAGKIHEVLRKPVRIDDEPIDVGASLGSATFPEDGDQADFILARADVALCFAKDHALGFARFAATLDQTRRSQLSLLSDLRRALERDELELWYQPKIDLARQAVDEVEALVRWRHPERGVVPPAEFIEFAERTGFIKEITRHVLDLAARQSAAWERRSLTLGISVNVSARDLDDGQLPEHVEDCFARHGARADRLRIEITETAMMASPASALAVLARLRAAGLMLSIDDFGVGQSSLSYLKRLPVQELKIDRSFVSGMLSDSDSAAIVRAAVDLGHTMGLSVVAEGVEDEATGALLAKLGCDAMQGYWISRPLGAKDLELWLAQCRWEFASRAGLQQNLLERA